MELQLTPEQSEVGRARRETASHLRSGGLSEGDASRCAMIVGELVANAVEYGDFDRDEAAIGVRLQVNAHTILIQVANPAGLRCLLNLPELDRTLRSARERRGLADGFQQKARGIPRIALEGRATLSYSMDEDLTLNAFAVTTSTGNAA